MAQYDVYPNPGGAGLLLDLQTDLLDGMETRVVAPLMPRDAAPTPAKRLNPVFVVDGVEHVLLVQSLAAVPASILTPPVANLTAQADAVTAAIDMVFHGF